MVSRNKLFLVSLAGMLMFAESLYAQYSGTYTIAFNGYCDSATVTLSAKSSFVSGTHLNYDCVGDSTWLAGVNSKVVGLFPKEGLAPIALADNVGVLLGGNSALTLYLNFTKQTWSYYWESTGIGPETLLNKGTFTIVEEAVTSGGKGASWQVPPTLEAEPTSVIAGYPGGTYNLLLDGYCDYFHLTATAHRVGGYHDYISCGYSYNAPTGGDYAALANDVVVEGSPGSLVGVAGKSLLTTDNGFEIDFASDETINFYFNFDYGLWSVYGADTTTGLALINWGTFTLVPDDPLTTRELTLPTGGIPSTTPRQ